MTLVSPVALELTRSPDDLKRRFFSLRTRADVADLLELPYGHLIYILYRAPHRYPYRVFQIPKRSGGFRRISAPHSSLQIVQSKLNTVLQLVYPARPCAHGFVCGRSTLSNALRHTAKRFVLNIDLEDFFPSINFGRVRGMFMAKPYGVEEQAATTLAKICCHDNQLPQGAPTSPMVSNMICGRLDNELLRLAKAHKCTYTRYADDLTFSTTLPAFPEELARHDEGWTGRNLTLGDRLVSVVESNGFHINARKQRLQYRRCHQEVTGLTVNRFPNVPRRFVRQVRAMLHAWETHGLEAAEREFREVYDSRARRPEGQPPSFGRVVRGKLDYIKMVKGEGDHAYRKLANKLHQLAPDLMDELGEEWPAYSHQLALRDRTWEVHYQDYQRSIFLVETRAPDGSVNAGTAFVWRRDALATAAHNVRGDVRVSLPLPEDVPISDYRMHQRAGEGVDVAVLRVPQAQVPHARRLRARREFPIPGEQVAVLGFASIPQRQPALHIVVGMVQSVAPTYAGTVDTIQISAEIAGGMSGGPVIDRGGNLVGIAMETTFEQTADDVPGRPFYHALPIRYLLDLDSEDHILPE
jgi:RNA-directed DNA polymerase